MTLDRPQIEEAAAYLFHLRVQRETAAALPFEIRPKNVEDAYAIQDAMHATAGWPIGVLKVGCTSEIAQEILGIPHPIGGRVPAEGVFASGAEIPASYFANAPAIECEFAIQVDEAGEPVAVAPALELVDPRVTSSAGFGGMTTIADNSAGCGVVLGTATPIEAAGDLVSHDVELRSGTGEVLATGSAAAVLGGPAASVDWTKTHEASRGRDLAGGAWIITGTCTGLTPTQVGGAYLADFGGLGQVSFSLA